MSFSPYVAAAFGSRWLRRTGPRRPADEAAAPGSWPLLQVPFGAGAGAGLRMYGLSLPDQAVRWFAERSFGGAL